MLLESPTCDLDASVPVWPAGSRTMVVTSIGIDHFATAEQSHL